MSVVDRRDDRRLSGGAGPLDRPLTGDRGPGPVRALADLVGGRAGLCDRAGYCDRRLVTAGL